MSTQPGPGGERPLDDPALLLSHLAQAEATYMLLEGLMARLLERQVFTVEELIETIEGVIDTKQHMAREGQHPQVSTRAAGLLKALANSLAATHRLNDGA